MNLNKIIIDIYTINHYIGDYALTDLFQKNTNAAIIND